MIAVDTSAILAVLWREPEAETFRAILLNADGICMSAVSLQEAMMVLAGRLPA